MAMGDGVQGVTGGRRPARRRRGRVLAADCDGWALWVPVDLWDAMTDHERAELARRQAALLEPARASTRPTTGKAGQLGLFGDD